MEGDAPFPFDEVLHLTRVGTHAGRTKFEQSTVTPRALPQSRPPHARAKSAKASRKFESGLQPNDVLNVVLVFAKLALPARVGVPAILHGPTIVAPVNRASPPTPPFSLSQRGAPMRCHRCPRQREVRATGKSLERHAHAEAREGSANCCARDRLWQDS